MAKTGNNHKINKSSLRIVKQEMEQDDDNYDNNDDKKGILNDDDDCDAMSGSLKTRQETKQETKQQKSIIESFVMNKPSDGMVSSSAGMGNNYTNIQQIKIQQIVNNHSIINNNNIYSNTTNNNIINNNNFDTKAKINFINNNLNNLDFGSLDNDLLIQSLLSLQSNNSNASSSMINNNGNRNISHPIIITPVQTISANNNIRLPTIQHQTIQNHAIQQIQQIQSISLPTINTVPSQQPTCINYMATHGQTNNFVAQQRYSPLLSTTKPLLPPNNLNINIIPNINGTVSVSLHNIAKPQALQLVTNTLNHYGTNNSTFNPPPPSTSTTTTTLPLNITTSNQFK